jgi:hypothetical protein
MNFTFTESVSAWCPVAPPLAVGGMLLVRRRRNEACAKEEDAHFFSVSSETCFIRASRIYSGAKGR